ncbi:uncharacterized protein LOC121740384 isoform X1 [Aricia agestis]|uniref:uncharacterized protein LOC121740384 isoform X1 n=2 Tax=Aricia agestis TaxID=91739 RepID=UPI001C209EE9|nr:uncharacterized protein LOC121740384 isoform X1 [Aricia agestis]
MVWRTLSQVGLILFFVISINASEDGVPMALLARISYPTVQVEPYNMPDTKEVNPRHSYANEKFEQLIAYNKYMTARIKEPHSVDERREILEGAYKKLSKFINTHIKDLKRLLFATDMALMSMVQLKLNKKMDASEAKIKATQAKIPFGLYVSPEFKCMGTSYYIASAHNQEDVQMILSSERKPHCYTFRGAFAFTGFFHRHAETTYVGPHGEQFQTKDPTQGLYCHSDDNWTDVQCIYKINPREEFPESVEYEPKVSYYCGPYRYFIPATTDIRCIFSIFSMNFILRFGYDGVTYKSSDLSFMYQNGQVFYTDEPWAGMSCWGWACKWRHNQNQRSNEFFVN